MKGQCWLCGKSGPTERHHIFGGALRQKSERYGLVLDLCHDCHNEPPDGVHFNAANMQFVRREGQRMAMRENGWDVEDFRREFYKNYLDEEA